MAPEDALVDELARRVENERALREIAARFAAITDPAVLLQHVTDEANRLVSGDGTILDVVQPGTRILVWAYDSGLARSFAPDEISDYTLPIGVGLTGRAVEERRVLVAGDDLVHEFPPSDDSDRFFELTGFRSMIAAPIGDDRTPLGALEVYSTRPDAFDDDDAALVGALADHAAVALITARRMADLTESKAEIARRAAEERSLRQMAARLTAIRQPETIVQETVDVAARLLRADGARIDLIDPVLRLLRGAYMSGGARPTEEEWPDTPDETIDTGISGLVVAEARTFYTGAYLEDDRFRHGSGSDTYIRNQGIHSVMAAPLIGEDGPFGAITVYTTRGEAFDDAGAELLEAIATQAAIAFANARLIEALDRSSRELARRAETERSLREIAARISAIRDPDAVIQHAVDECVRLLDAGTARIELIDRPAGRLRAAYISARGDTSAVDERARAGRPLGTGVGGKVVADGATFFTGAYLDDTRFEHDAEEDDYVRQVDLRSVLSVPLYGGSEVIGVLSAGSKRADAFDTDDAAVLEALATQVSVAIATARLIEELGRSRHEVARRAETERALRQIAARITALHEPATILEQAAAEAGTLLDAEGATVDLLRPVGIATGFFVGIGLAQDEGNAPELMDLETAAGVGISGRAISEGRPIATGDYLTDDTFQHEASRDEFIRSQGIHSVMAAPLITEGVPVGVINVHALRVDAFGPDELRIIGAIADIATLAVTNAGLMERIQASDERHRRLAVASPDLIWSASPDGVFTFISEASRDFLGYAPDELVGRHFMTVVAPSAVARAAERWQQLLDDPATRQLVPLQLVTRDGTEVPSEITAVGVVVDGRLDGIHGSTRDVRTRERLELELRRQAAEIAASEERAHLARELHDSVTQALFSMTLITRSIELLLARDPAAAGERLETLGELQRDALAEMRALIFELRPGSLERDGLVEALRTHAAAVEGRTGLSIVVDCDELPSRLALGTEDVLYRIGQEALHNVVKHAGASRARIAVAVSDGTALLTVEDDGVGFDPAAIPPGHLGIEGMRVRAERTGGRLEVDAAPGRGTLIRASLPVAPSGDRSEP